MNWMYEPRGNYYDQGDEEGSYSPPMKWYEVVVGILGMLLFGLLVALGDLLMLLYGFYSIVKATYEKGEIEFPNLTIIGICLAGVLWIAYSNFGFEFADHPFIAFWSALYIFYSTLAPLAGLFLLFLRLLFQPAQKGENHE